MYDDLDDYEFEHGVPMRSDYDPDRIPPERCALIQQVGTELVRCPELVDGRVEGCLCTAHAIAGCHWSIDRSRADGDDECVDMYLDDLAKLTGVKARAELKLAA